METKDLISAEFHGIEIIWWNEIDIHLQLLNHFGSPRRHIQVDFSVHESSSRNWNRTTRSNSGSCLESKIRIKTEKARQEKEVTRFENLFSRFCYPVIAQMNERQKFSDIFQKLNFGIKPTRTVPTSDEPRRPLRFLPEEEPSKKCRKSIHVEDPPGEQQGNLVPNLIALLVQASNYFRTQQPR